MLASLLLACAAFQPAPTPSDVRVAVPAVIGSGPVKRAVVMTSPSRGLWSPATLPPVEQLRAQGRLGVVTARVRDPAHPWAEQVRTALIDDPSAWPLALTERIDGCDALQAALAEAPAASWRALLGCPTAWLEERRATVPEAARPWLLPPADADPLADLDALIGGMEPPHEVVARFPLHRAALGGAFARCADDDDRSPVQRSRCLWGVALTDPARAARLAPAARQRDPDDPVARSLTAWSTPNELSDALDDLGLANEPGAAEPELIAELARRGRVGSRVPGEVESQLASLLERLGIEGVVIDSLHPATDAGTSEMALHAHVGDRRLRVMLDPWHRDREVIVGFANALADHVDADERLLLIVHGGIELEIAGPEDSLVALVDEGWVTPLPPHVPGGEQVPDTGLNL